MRNFARRGGLRPALVCSEKLESRVMLSVANDNFSGRINIIGSTATMSGTNVTATKQASEPNHAGNAGGASVWWKWTASSTGQVQFDTFGSTFDTLLAVYTGSGVSILTLVAGNDDQFDMTSRVTFQAIAGTTYQIAVDGYDAAQGDITLHLSTPPANDHFANRAVINGSSVNLTATNSGASKEVSETDHAGKNGGSSVWWTWTASASGHVQIDTLGSDFDTLLGIYTGNALGSLVQVVSNDDYFEQTSMVTFNAVAGTTYQIAVDGFDGVQGNISLQLRTPPANDDFANRVTINGSSATVNGSNLGGTKQASEPNHAGDVGGASVWWSWTASSTGSVRIDTLGSEFDTLLAVYTGANVASLSEVASNDDVLNFGSQVTFNAVAGTTYQIAVDGFDGSQGNVTLRLQTVPVNDNFANRTTIGGASGTVTGSNLFGGKEAGETNHAGSAGGASVWWTWTAAFSAEVEINTTGTAFDTLLGVYTGSNLASLTTIASNDDDGLNPTSKLTLSAIAGTAYQIAVDGYEADGGISGIGDITLNIIVRPTTLDINGTGSDDVVTVNASGVLTTVIINGTQYDFDPVNLTAIGVHGQNGADTLHVVGTTGVDNVTFNPGTMDFVGSWIDIDADGFEAIDVASGGGEDLAYLYDSAGNDTFEASPASATLQGTGFSNTVTGFRRAYAYSYTGGVDTVELTDSSGNDNFVGEEARSWMTGANYYNSASRFELVEAYATSGNDLAMMWDAVGVDTFEMSPTSGALYGIGYDNRSYGFDRVYAYSYAGGIDEAYLYDSSGDDRFIGKDVRSTIQNADISYYGSASRFEKVYAFAVNGGNDRADLNGTADNDVLVSGVNTSTMSAAAYFYEVTAFETVNAYAGAGGSDSSTISDTAGNDSFLSLPTASYMTWSNGTKLSSFAFNSVAVTLLGGGNDTAEFRTLSTLDSIYGLNGLAEVTRNGGSTTEVTGLGSGDTVIAQSSGA
ncbi:MAG: hypothetical protein WD065_10310, partial [Planctomycetaceae bacterium]